MFSDIIYYIYGHSFYIEKGNPENDPLNIELESSRDNIMIVIPDISEERSSIKTRLKYLVCMFYNAVIIALIGWSIIFIAIDSIRKKTKELMPTEIFQLAFLTQYIIGLWYFNTPSYLKSITKYDDIKKSFKIISIISLVAVLSISLLSILLIIFNEKLNQNGLFHNVYRQTPALIFFLCLNRFYTYSAFFANMAIFFTQMYYSKKTFNKYTDEAKKYIKSSYSLIDKVTYITTEFQKIKNDYDNMIDDLNLFFSSLSIIGIIGVYFAIISILTGKIDSIETIHSILFLITEILYINTAQSLRKSINEVENLIKEPIMLQEFSQKGRQTNMNINSDPNYAERETQINVTSLMEICTVTFMCCKEIEEHMLWKKLDDILKAQWNSFQFFGIKITDTALLQKIFGLVIAFIFTSNIMSISNFASLN
jgi:hypothetical protein